MLQKAVLRGKFIPIQAFLKTGQKSQIDNLICHQNELEKEAQTKPKVSRRIKQRFKKKKKRKERKTTTEKISKTKSWLFEKVNKMDKPLARRTKKRREKIQINKIRYEKGEISTATAEIKKKKKIL